MTTESVFSDDATTDVPGMWYVAATTPILYSQVDPHEVFLILGYNLGGGYPDRTSDQSGSEAVGALRPDALVQGSNLQYVSALAIRAPSSPDLADGEMRIEVSTASDVGGGSGHGFTPTALVRGILAIQVLPWRTVHRVPLGDLIDSDAVGWIAPVGFSIDWSVWQSIAAATGIRVALIDPAERTIDDHRLLFDADRGAVDPVDVVDFDARFPAPALAVAATEGPFWIDIEKRGARYGPLRDVIGWESQEIWDEGSRFSFRAVRKGAAIEIEELCEIYAYTIVGGHVTLVGAGIVENIDEAPTETETTLAVSGPGFESELLDDVAPALSFDNATHGDIVASISDLLPTGWELYADPELEELRYSMQLGGDSLLDAIQTCAELSGTRLQFGLGRVIRMRTYYRLLDIVVGALPWEDPENVGAGGEHISARGGNRVTGLRIQRDARQMVTVVEPYGASPELTLAEATEPAPDGYTLDASENTLALDEAVNSYGIRRRKHIFRRLVVDLDDQFLRVDGANRLLALAAGRLQQYGKPVVFHHVTVSRPQQLIQPFALLEARIFRGSVQIADSYRVGDVTTSYSAETGIQQSLTLASDQIVRAVDDERLLARRLLDMVAGLDSAGEDRPVDFVGVIRTPDQIDSIGVPAVFVAGPDDQVVATITVEKNGGGTSLSRTVDEGQPQSIDAGLPVDISDAVLLRGTHRLRVKGTPTPAIAIEMTARISVRGA